MPPNRHTHYRDLSEWRNYGLKFSTQSDQAVKLWDASLTQYVGWYEDQSLGGLEKTLKDMIAADPTFAMGRVMSIGLDFMGAKRTVRTDPSFQAEIDELDKLSTGNSWEERHVKAVKLCAKGEHKLATLVWQDILKDFPQDLLALKFAYDQYYYFGQQREMRDSVARVLPHWKETWPLYGYLHGFHAFGLVETNLFAHAGVAAKKALDYNSLDAGAVHALAHVFEMQAKTNEGLVFMNKTLDDWTQSPGLACHNYWHIALFHIEKNDHQAAVDVFDNEVTKRCKSGNWYDIVDACSLLFRLEMEGVNVGQERWEEVYEIGRQHQDNHIAVFNDVHLLMSYLGAKKPEMTKNLMDSIRKYVEDFGDKDKWGKVTKEVGLPLYQALQAYDAGDFEGAVQALLPIRYQIVNMGGSNAQRDVFDLLLVNAAMRSGSYGGLCQSLIHERKALKRKSGLNDRLMDRWVETHNYKPVSGKIA